MFDQPAPFLWDCVWQSTLILLMGGVLSRIWTHWPARAHRIMLLALGACLLTPLASQFVGQCGWGIFPQAVSMPLGHVQDGNVSEQIRTGALAARSKEVITEGSISASEALTASQAGPEPATTCSPLRAANANAGPWFSWNRLFVVLWIALSSVVVARLLLSIGKELSALRQAEPLTDRRILSAVDRARTQLGLKSIPRLFISNRVQCPVICCWQLRPALLFPGSAFQTIKTNDLTAILCHELAHLKRRDYLVTLLGEVVCCFLPWQPLVWWAKRRLHQFSELACDNWVLACGHSAESYAESLLKMLPQQKPVFALAAVNHRKKMESRIHHILEGKRTDPRPGRRWACAAAVGMACIIGAMGFAQAQVATAESSQDTAESADTPPNPSLTLRRVTDGFGGRSPKHKRVSRDGKYMSFVDWDTGDVAVREIASGKTRRITNKGSWDESNDFAWYPAISPDNTQVGYGWYHNNKESYDLRLIGFDGSDLRVLATNPASEIGYSELIEWSPSGKEILARYMAGEREEPLSTLAWISVADESVKVLKTLGKLWAGNACHSPDGRCVAYELARGENSSEYDIFLLDIDENREIPLVRHPANGRLLGWSPDGKWVVFTSDRLGSNDAWIVPIERGKPQGIPRRVKKSIGDGIVPLGSTKDGAFYYNCGTGTVQIYHANFDLAKGILLDSITPFSRDAQQELLIWPAWSHDGKYLACSSPLEGVFIQLMETGEVRKLMNESMAQAHLRWSANDRSIWACGVHKHYNRFHIVEIDVARGEVTPVLQDDIVEEYCAVEPSRDGSTIFYRCDLSDATKRVVRRDLKSGLEKELYRHPNLERPLALSPDEKWLAFCLDPTLPEEAGWHYTGNELHAPTLEIIPSRGGEPRQLVKLENPDIRFFEWAPDSNHLLFVTWEGQRTSFWKISLQGGVPEKFFEIDTKIRIFRFHPDSGRIAFESGNRTIQEVWVMENFLPQE